MRDRFESDTPKKNRERKRSLQDHRGGDRPLPVALVVNFQCEAAAHDVEVDAAEPHDHEERQPLVLELPVLEARLVGEEADDRLAEREHDPGLHPVGRVLVLERHAVARARPDRRVHEARLFQPDREAPRNDGFDVDGVDVRRALLLVVEVDAVGEAPAAGVAAAARVPARLPDRDGEEEEDREGEADHFDARGGPDLLLRAHPKAVRRQEEDMAPHGQRHEADDERRDRQVDGLDVEDEEVVVALRQQDDLEERARDVRRVKEAMNNVVLREGRDVVVHHRPAAPDVEKNDGRRRDARRRQVELRVGHADERRHDHEVVEQLPKALRVRLLPELRALCDRDFIERDAPEVAVQRVAEARLLDGGGERRERRGRFRCCRARHRRVRRRRIWRLRALRGRRVRRCGSRRLCARGRHRGFRRRGRRRTRARRGGH
mmetsp:Transcript_7598/g.23903  ORF Transcript_7598/g.23903 Transcript_7598/m.23903 type:complete len:433 (+) Transcript_7598:994-2292(+)